VNTRAGTGLLLLVALACGPRETALPQRRPMSKTARVTPADLAGCYAVETGRWLPPIDVPIAAGLELTLEHVQRGNTGLAPVRPAGAVEHAVRFESHSGPGRYGRWNLTGPSDAEITWSSAAVAIRAEVTVDRKSRNLTGTVRTVNAPQPDQSAAEIRMFRKPC
jgi:hypothetical protein